jgi:hypothetical protein
MFVIWLFTTQIFYALFKGYPLFWIFRPETFQNHLKKAQKEIDAAEQMTRQYEGEAEKYLRRGKELAKGMEDFQKNLKKKGKRR